MKKQTLILTLLAVSNLAYSAVNVNYQKTVSKTAELEQREGTKNQQAINDASSKSEWVGIGQTYKSDKTTMIQKNAKDSEMYLNKAKVAGKTFVYQSADIKKLQTKQQGGSNNKLAVNKLDMD